ncbi:MAG: hypothetical protein AAGM22_28960 [Acidobacteriota bacterium]
MSTFSLLRPVLCLSLALSILAISLHAQAPDLTNPEFLPPEAPSLESLGWEAHAPDPDALERRRIERESQDRVLQKAGAELASALERPDFRRWLHHEIATSPWVEHRVAFKRAEAPEKSAALSVTTLEALKELPDLELYFPIPGHREAWDGGDAVPVAVPTAEGFLVFWNDGRTRSVPESFNPKTPTLLLARSEIEYDDAPSALRGGRRTGSPGGRLHPEKVEGRYGASLECGGTSKTFTTRQYSYVTHFKIKEDFEGPFRGKMEIEIIGHLSPDRNPTRSCSRFTGLEVNDELNFPVGLHRVARGVPTIPAFPGDGNHRLVTWVFEDDNTPCFSMPEDDFVGSAGWRADNLGEFRPGTRFDIRVEPSTRRCGNSICESGETCSGCPEDCGECTCGNGICGIGEDCTVCLQDCGPCAVCGDGFCEINESSLLCPNDCGAQ